MGSIRDTPLLPHLALILPLSGPVCNKIGAYRRNIKKAPFLQKELVHRCLPVSIPAVKTKPGRRQGNGQNGKKAQGQNAGVTELGFLNRHPGIHPSSHRFFGCPSAASGRRTGPRQRTQVNVPFIHADDLPMIPSARTGADPHFFVHVSTTQLVHPSNVPIHILSPLPTSRSQHMQRWKGWPGHPSTV